jgi:hypothetical protein
MIPQRNEKKIDTELLYIPISEFLSNLPISEKFLNSRNCTKNISK